LIRDPASSSLSYLRAKPLAPGATDNYPNATPPTVIATPAKAGESNPGPHIVASASPALDRFAVPGSDDDD
jgi:hypothetical protein